MVMTITLYDLIMGRSCTENFSREDWAALGRGEITDEKVIQAMLAEGYEALGNG